MMTSIELTGSAPNQTPVLSLTRPGPDPTFEYVPELGFTLDDFAPIPEGDYEIISSDPHPDATETLRYRILADLSGQRRVFFRFRATRVE
jgi:hypothetical protein